jgi:hypothetical protein
MKQICFTFDAFGQWSEHDWSATHGWSTNDWWPASHLLRLFFLSPLISTSLAQPPHLWDKVEGQLPHGLTTRPPLGSPIKVLPRGVFSFIPQDHN